MVESDTKHATYFRQKAGEAAVAGQAEVSLIAARRALLLEPFDPVSCYYLSLSSRNIDALSDSGRLARWAVAALQGRFIVPLHRELFTLAGLAEDDVSMLRRAVLMAPENGDGHYNLGNAEDRANRPEDGLLNFRWSQVIRPLHSASLGNIARIKALILGHDDAAEALRKALCAAPSDFLSLRNYGLWRRGKDDPHAAICWFRRAVAVNPSREAEGELGRALMIVGALEEGWRRLEYFRLFDLPAPIDGLPRWDGRTLDDGSLLLWSMDQLGDELFFSTFLQRAVHAAGRVTLLVDPRNRSLMRYLYPEVRVIESIDEAFSGGSKWKVSACYPFDFVGRYFAKKPEELSEQGRERVLRKNSPPRDLLHVGISWKSSAEIISGLKSTNLSEWRDILVHPGCRFFSLQYGDVTDDLAAFPSIETIKGFDPFGTTLDFAKAVADLDLVISVNNTTTHITARTSTPVWALIPCGLGHSWVWLRQGNRTPAYPNARLFRQSVPGDWNSVFRDVQSELTAWVRSRE